VSNVPDFLQMSAEEILTLIEEADKILDQKIAGEKAELAERVLKLQKLEARRAGKAGKAKAAPAKPRHVNGKANGKSESVSSVQPATPAE
jgi:hypothetical protein